MDLKVGESKFVLSLVSSPPVFLLSLAACTDGQMTAGGCASSRGGWEELRAACCLLPAPATAHTAVLECRPSACISSC